MTDYTNTFGGAAKDAADDVANAADLDTEFDAIVTAIASKANKSKVEATGDTSAGDNAAMGYTATEGLVLTGQGSTNDITMKNDADADVITIPTGTTRVQLPGTLEVEAYNEDADQYTIGSGTIDFDVSVATYFYPNADFGTNTPTFTFSNPASSGRVSSFTLEMLGADDATITWPASVDWANGAEPTWTSGVDIVSFITRDGGTTWFGFLGGQAFA